MAKLISYTVIAARLAELRLAAGNPSFTEITKLVRDVRAARGVPPEQQTPARITVYDCFKRNRRRFDLDLVVDIGRALGLDPDAAVEWEQLCWSVQSQLDAARIVTVRTRLPDAPVRLVGRATELATLTDPGGGVHLVHGMAGSGKTTLVGEAVRQLRAAERAHAVVFVDLRGSAADRPAADSGAAFDAIVRVLEGPRPAPTTDDRRRRLLGELLADRRAVLVLDDAASVAQVRSLLPIPPTGRPPGHTFVTSRRAMARLLGAGDVPLGELTTDAAAQLLGSLAGATAADWPVAELRGLTETVGRLPLAIGVLGARIAEHTDWSPADHRRSLLGPGGDVRVAAPVTAALDGSHATMSAEAARTLRLLACLPFDDLAEPMLDDVIERESRGITDELVAANMATRRNGRLTLHALVRAHARDRSLDVDRPSDRDAALARVLDALVAGARAASAAAAPRRPDPPRYPIAHQLPEPDASAGLAWLDAEFENLLVAAGADSSAARPAVAVELAELLAWYIDRTVRHADGLILFARAVAAARDLGDDLGQAGAEIGRGQAYVRLGDLERGMVSLRRAEILATGDDRTSGTVQVCLGVLAFQGGDYPAAHRHLSRAAELYEPLGHHGDLARVHGNLAVLGSRTHDFDGAAAHFARAAGHATAAGDPESAAYIWTNTAGTHLARRDPQAALDAAEKALELAAAHQIRAVLGPARNNLVGALKDLRRFDEAIAEAGIGLDEARRTADRQTEIELRVNLGEIHRDNRNWEAATTELTAAAHLAADLDDDFQRGRALAATGYLHRDRGDLAAARQCWRDALQTLGDDEPIAEELRAELAELMSAP